MITIVVNTDIYRIIVKTIVTINDIKVVVAIPL